MRIPKPYGVGLFYSDLIENALEWAANENGEDAAKNLAWAVPHHLWFMDYPGVIAPTIEDMRNRNFTGAPIVPEYMQDLSPRYQFRENTSEAYKRIGDALNVSPLRMQHYARGFFGYIESMAMVGADAILWDEEKWGERPFPTEFFGDYVFKQFRQSPYPFRTKYTEAYYDLRQRARTAAGDLRFVTKNAGKRPRMLEDLTEQEEVLFFANLDRQMAQIDRSLSRMRDAVDTIKYHPTMTRDEKETQIETLYRQRDAMLTDAYSQINSAVRAMEKAVE